jgi:transcriptional regulator with XRE-family HTH domain
MPSTTVPIDGGELRTRRLRRRLHQYELAEHIGMDQGHLSRLESGQRTCVSVGLLRRIERQVGRLDAPDPELVTATTPPDPT